MSILERLRKKEDKLKEATEEEALDYLKSLMEPVVGEEKERQVLTANILEEGKVGPLVWSSGRPTESVEIISTPNGWRRVDDETWAEALDELVNILGLGLQNIVGDSEESVCFRTTRNTFRQETYFPSEFLKNPALYLIVVKEFDPETLEPTLLGLEIGNKPPKV